MDYSKLADEFIEEGAWQGAPVIAVSMFAKWLEEREAAQQTFAVDGALCACKLPGFDANEPSKCPTCGKSHRR